MIAEKELQTLGTREHKNQLGSHTTLIGILRCVSYWKIAYLTLTEEQRTFALFWFSFMKWGIDHLRFISICSWLQSYDGIGRPELLYGPFLTSIGEYDWCSCVSRHTESGLTLNSMPFISQWTWSRLWNHVGKTAAPKMLELQKSYVRRLLIH